MSGGRQPGRSGRCGGEHGRGGAGGGGATLNAQRKITGSHLERLAVVYLRQSSPAQVRLNTRSTERQYALADEAARLGWERERIVVVDGDLGISGRGATRARATRRWSGGCAWGRSARCSVWRFRGWGAPTRTITGCLSSAG